MANFTRKAIQAAFVSLLEERPLSEITVKDIVEKCDINRNSFYYHYKDLGALIDEIVNEQASAIIAKYASVDSILDCYDHLIEFASCNRRAILHIYKSVSRDVFEYYLMELSKYFVHSYAEMVIGKLDVNIADRELIETYYKCTFFGLVIDWLNSGMDEEYAKSIRRVFVHKEDKLLGFVEQLKQRKS